VAHGGRYFFRKTGEAEPSRHVVSDDSIKGFQMKELVQCGASGARARAPYARELGPRHINALAKIAIANEGGGVAPAAV
jgi:hypothetical protein